MGRMMGTGRLWPIVSATYDHNLRSFTVALKRTLKRLSGTRMRYRGIACRCARIAIPSPGIGGQRRKLWQPASDAHDTVPALATRHEFRKPTVLCLLTRCPAMVWDVGPNLPFPASGYFPFRFLDRIFALRAADSSERGISVENGLMAA